MVKFVRAATLEGFAQIVQEQRASAAELLQAAGVPANALLDPDLKFRVEALAALLDLTVRRTGFLDLPFRMAAGRRASTWGPMGLLLTKQKTLRAGLTILMDFIYVHNEAARLDILDYDDRSIFTIEYDVDPYPVAFDISYGHELGVSIVIEVIRSIVGPRWKPKDVYFKHEAKGDVRRYATFLGITPLFGSDLVGIAISRDDFESSLPHFDPAMEAIARTLVVEAFPRRRSGLLEDVTATIEQLLPSGTPTLKRVAKMTGFNARTLQRNLAALDKSFGLVLQETRLRRAKFYVESSSRSLTEVTGLLGFSSPSSFARWYVANHGVSAGEARRRAENSPD